MTKYECLEHFLWFKPGQIVDEIDPGWTPFFKVSEDEPVETAEPIMESSEEFEEEKPSEPKKRGRKKKGTG
jgi:hypothetical protein